ncbi:MAG: hypothetical protein ABJC13_17025 [Acidobacteriota bacterium]
MTKGAGHNFNPTAGIHVQVGLVAFTLLLGSFSCHGNGPNDRGATEPSGQIPANLPPLSQSDPIGGKELDAVRPTYEAVLKQNEDIVRSGRIVEASQRLLDVVSENNRTAAHNLYVGNLLYGLDPKQSYALHLEALRQQPDSANTNLEAAFELQRAGQGQAACVLFERYVTWNPSYKVINALWAHCLLEQDDLRRAVDAWNRADHTNHHVEIDERISDVFGLRNPWLVRSELMGKVS